MLTLFTQMSRLSEHEIFFLCKSRKQFWPPKNCSRVQKLLMRERKRERRGIINRNQKVLLNYVIILLLPYFYVVKEAVDLRYQQNAALLHDVTGSSGKFYATLQKNTAKNFPSFFFSLCSSQRVERKKNENRCPQYSHAVLKEQLSWFRLPVYNNVYISSLLLFFCFL